jgi:hypothetical protein
MGMLKLTAAQWSNLQIHPDRQQVIDLFARVHLGQPAGVDAVGVATVEGDTPAGWVFDDHRIGGCWRVRVNAGNIFVQNWDEPVAGSMVSEMTLAEAIAMFIG